jgi:hypothetical protein
MTASYILDKVSALRPNPYGSYLGDYLKSLDMRIRSDILGETDPVYSENKLALAEKDFYIYELFLFSVIDLLNGEYGRYENSREAFEAEYLSLTRNNAESDEEDQEHTEEKPDTAPESSYEGGFKIW